MTEIKEKKYDLTIGQIIISLDRLYGKRRRQEMASKIGKVPDVSAVLSTSALKMFNLSFQDQCEILDGLDKENYLWIYSGKEHNFLTQLETCPIFETKCSKCSRKIIKLRNGDAFSKEGFLVMHQYIRLQDKIIYKYQVYLMHCSKCKKECIKEGKMPFIDTEQSKVDESDLWVGETILAIDRLYGTRRAQEACINFRTHRLFPTPSSAFLSIIELPLEKQAALINTLNINDVLWSNFKYKDKKNKNLGREANLYSPNSSYATLCRECNTSFLIDCKISAVEADQVLYKIIIDDVVIYQYTTFRFLCKTCVALSQSNSSFA